MLTRVIFATLAFGMSKTSVEHEMFMSEPAVHRRFYVKFTTFIIIFLLFKQIYAEFTWLKIVATNFT